MNAVEQYLKDVGVFLPGPTRDDIVNELREDIQSQIEDREAEAGRSLDEGEVKALLARIGRPVTVAARFTGDQGTLSFGGPLIGPGLFRLYKKVLAINVGICLVVVAGVSALATLSDIRRLVRGSRRGVFM